MADLNQAPGEGCPGGIEFRGRGILFSVRGSKRFANDFPRKLAYGSVRFRIIHNT